MLRRLFAFLILVALSVAGLFYWSARTGRRIPFLPHLPGLPWTSKPADALRDARTTLGVTTALHLVRSLKPYVVDAASEDGVVTLRGTLPHDDLRALAVRTAASVPGVRQVVDHVKVDPTVERTEAGAERTVGESLDDHALEVQVRLAFSLNRELEGADIEVHSFKRRVTLSGEVAREAQRRLAVAVAKETPSVDGVVDEIRVRQAGKPKPARPSARTQAEARATAGLRPSIADRSFVAGIRRSMVGAYTLSYASQASPASETRRTS